MSANDVAEVSGATEGDGVCAPALSTAYPAGQGSMKTKSQPLDFLVGGAPRCATSWLHLCLCEHPEVYVPPLKEILFFSHHYDKGLEWYKKRFHPSGDRRVGECSPSYLSHPLAPQRIHQAAPDSRLVFVIREPIERAYSDYCTQLNAGQVSSDVASELVPGRPIVEDGLYYRHLKNYHRYFRAAQIKVIRFEQLQAAPGQVLEDVFRFIGVDPGFHPKITNRVFHYRKPRKSCPRLHRALARAFSFLALRQDWFARLFNDLRSRDRFAWYHRLMNGPRYPALTPEIRGKLSDYYLPDTLRLAELLQCDLSVWTGHSSIDRTERVDRTG
jgi:hypothetical protein